MSSETMNANPGQEFKRGNSETVEEYNERRKNFIINEIHRVVDKLGQVPSSEEYVDNCRYGAGLGPMRRHFGGKSYNEILKQLGYTPKHEPPVSPGEDHPARLSEEEVVEVAKTWMRNNKRDRCITRGTFLKKSSDEYPSLSTGALTHKFGFESPSEACTELLKRVDAYSHNLEVWEAFIKDELEEGRYKPRDLSKMMTKATGSSLIGVSTADYTDKLVDDAIEDLNERENGFTINRSCRMYYISFDSRDRFESHRQEVKNKYGEEWVPVFDKKLSEGRSPRTIKAAIHYIVTDDLQDETSVMYDVTNVAIRRNYKDIESQMENGVDDTYVCETCGKKTIKGYECKRQRGR